MSTRHKIAHNTLAQVIGKGINTTSALIITFLIGRLLGAEFYGDFSKVFATTTFLLMALDFGLNATVIKRITQNPNSKTSEFQHLLGLRIAISAALYIGLLIFLFIAPTPAQQGYNLIVKISIAVFALQYWARAAFLSSNAIFQKNLQYIRSVTASSIGALTQLALVIWLVSSNASLLAISTAHLLGTVAMGIAALMQVRSLVGSVLPKFDINHSLKLIKKTLPLGLALIFNLIATRLDIIILTLMGSTTDVGFYGLARRVFDVVLVFPTFFMNSTYPILLDKIKTSQHGIKSIFRKSLGFLFASSFISLIGLFIAAPLVTSVAPEFAATVTALRILALFLPLFFVSNLLLWTTIATDNQKYLIRIYGSAAVINVFINLIAIPHLGYLAPAIAAGVTEAIILTLLIKPVKSYFEDHEPNS